MLARQKAPCSLRMLMPSGYRASDHSCDNPALSPLLDGRKCRVKTNPGGEDRLQKRDPRQSSSWQEHAQSPGAHAGGRQLRQSLQEDRCSSAAHRRLVCRGVAGRRFAQMKPEVSDVDPCRDRRALWQRESYEVAVHRSRRRLLRSRRVFVAVGNDARANADLKAALELTGDKQIRIHVTPTTMFGQ